MALPTEQPDPCESTRSPELKSPVENQTLLLDHGDIGEAVDILRAGGLVAFPTETVYGLGADASADDAVAGIYRAKGRPAGHPLIIHVSDAASAWQWALAPEPAARVLAEAFWPGPLSIVVPRSDKASSLAVGGLDTVGLRVPAHPIALELLSAFDGGIAAPSANRFGHVSPTTAAHVLDDLAGLIDAVIDGGPTEVGLESTIVEVVSGSTRLLRPGRTTVEQVSACLAAAGLDGLDLADVGMSRAPGMLSSHYAPVAEVVVLAEGDPHCLVEKLKSISDGTAVAVLAPFPVDHQASFLLPDDSEGFGHGLYAALRLADQSLNPAGSLGPAMSGAGIIVVVTPKAGPLSPALADRLRKASSARN